MSECSEVSSSEDNKFSQSNGTETVTVIEIKDERMEYKSLSLLVCDVGDQSRIKSLRCTI